MRARCPRRVYNGHLSLIADILKGPSMLGAVAMAALISVIVVLGRLQGQKPRWRRRPDGPTGRIVGGAVVILFVSIEIGKLLFG